MPIRIIKKIASKLGSKPEGKSSSSGDHRRSDAKLPPSRGSAAVAKGAEPEVWRPGDPVPASKPASKNKTEQPRRRPRKQRSSDRDASKQPAAAKSDAALSSTRSKPSADKADSDKPDERASVSNSRRRSRGGRRRSRKPDANAQAASGEANAETPKAQQVDAAAPPRQSPATEKPWTRDDYVVEPAEGKLRFLDADLPDSILHALSDMGFQYCTPIQARVLQEVAEGHNVAGRAQTGTGKTAAFLLLTFKQFLQNPISGERPKGKPRALILAPTRELVIQIVRDAEAIGKYSGMNCMAVYGGADYDRQEHELLKAPVDLIAATPGRLLDFRRKGTLDLRQVEVLVIDEADRMLDMGFIPDVRTIIRSTPQKDRRRTLLFSATLSDDVMRLASQWMPDPHVVEIEPENVAVDTVKQLVYMVRADQKFTVLYNLLKRPNIGRVLVFANRRDQTDRIAFELKRYGIDCQILSGAVDQKKRMRVLDDFRSGKLRIVVATDVAGRGLHVDNIDHVVNFDLPYEAEDYVHRIGRTGRAGEEGTAVSFACEDESFGIPEIEEYIGETMSCQYPEDVLLKPLPPTKAPSYVRPPRRPASGNRGGNSRGGRSSGGRSRPRR
jgi:ATP-dependent RNA helicase RhlB